MVARQAADVDGTLPQRALDGPALQQGAAGDFPNHRGGGGAFIGKYGIDGQPPVLQDGLLPQDRKHAGIGLRDLQVGGAHFMGPRRCGGNGKCAHHRQDEREQFDGRAGEGTYGDGAEKGFPQGRRCSDARIRG